MVHFAQPHARGIARILVAVESADETPLLRASPHSVQVLEDDLLGYGCLRAGGLRRCLRSGILRLGLGRGARERGEHERGECRRRGGREDF